MAKRRTLLIQHWGHDITIKGGEVYFWVERFCSDPKRQCAIRCKGDSISLYFPVHLTQEEMDGIAKDLKSLLQSKGCEINPTFWALALLAAPDGSVRDLVH